MNAQLKPVPAPSPDALADLPTRDSRVLDTPTIAIESLSSGAISLRVQARCTAMENIHVQRDLRTAVKAALDEADIAIAAPAAQTPPAAGSPR